MLPLAFSSNDKHSFKEDFTFEDGDFTELAWSQEPKNPKDIVILFHGLGGSIHSHYIQGMMKTLTSIDYTSVVMHFRGCSGRANTTERSYHAGETGDAKAFIAHLKQRYPKAILHAVGYSLGANMLLKLLAEYKEDSPLASAVAISAPLELDKCTHHINQGFAKVYQVYLLKALKAALLQKVQLLDLKSEYGLDEKRVKKIKTIYEFDDIYTAPVHGFKNAVDYYKQNSSRQFLKEIQTPTLLIHSFDDPFMPPSIFPKKEELSESIVYEVGHFGGHVGFIEGSLFKPEFWLEKRVKKFFTKGA